MSDVPDIMKIQAVWSGWAGGPGTNTFFLLGTDPHLDLFSDFYITFQASLPSGVSVTMETSGSAYDDATGELTGGWTAASEPAASGSDTSGFAAGVGAVVRWNTGAINNNHRVRGHTFLVPLGRSCYQDNGTIATANLASFQTAADNLWTGLDSSLVAWHRPVGGSGGAAALVTSSLVPDRVAMLKSRRG